MITQSRYLSDDEVTQLLKYLPSRFPPESRNRALIKWRFIILLMLDSGLRVGELVRLKWSSLMNPPDVLESVFISKLSSKSNYDRFVPLTPRLKSLIKQFYNLKFTFSTFDYDQFVLTGGTPLGCLSERAVQLMVRRICHDCLHRNVTPHMLRHTFATRVMRHAPLSVVQALLGHSSVQSTQVYLHPTIQDSIKAIKSIR